MGPYSKMLAGGEMLSDEGKIEFSEVPLMPAPSMPSMPAKTRKRGGASTPSRWVWSSFVNAARRDGLELSHWTKKTSEVLEYPYAAFNVRLERVEYSEADYERYLRDSTWTMADTDHLMELCYQLDLRWPVIADRYLPIPSRPVEQLQARYYFVARALADAGVLKRKRRCDDDATLGVSARTRDFDVGYEEKRRRQLHAVFCRTKAEEAEERALREELKEVELESKRLKKSARAYAQAAQAHRAAQQTQHAAAAASAAAGSATTTPVASSSSSGAAASQPTTTTTTLTTKQQAPSSQQQQLDPAQQRQVATLQAAQQRQQLLQQHHLAQQQQQQAQLARQQASREQAELLARAEKATAARRPVPGQPFLQSARLRLPDAQPGGLSRGMVKKLGLVLDELGVTRPTPTKLACDAYDDLRRDVVALLSLQKLATTKQAELARLRALLDDPHRHAVNQQQQGTQHLGPTQQQQHLGARTEQQQQQHLVGQPQQQLGQPQPAAHRRHGGGAAGGAAAAGTQPTMPAPHGAPDRPAGGTAASKQVKPSVKRKTPTQQSQDGQPARGQKRARKQQQKHDA